MSIDIEKFINDLQRDPEGHVILNMWDNSILHDSFLESALRCSAPKFERKPRKIRFVQKQNPWQGITVFTDKVLHLASHIQSAIKVAWLIEPYDLLPEIYKTIINFEDNYDFIFTYEQTLLDRNPQKYKFHPCDTSGIELESHKMHKKTKLVSMIYSEKTWLFGHRLRHIIAKRLLPEMNYDKIDFFGRGTDHPLELKSQGTNDYMFQIAIENAKRQNYFADKIYDCFVTGTIPIYWGAPNVGDFFDERGILAFHHPDELREILLSLSEEKYNSMLESANNNFEEVQKYLRPDDLFYENTIKHLRRLPANG
jgi:hypothetical protein